MGAGESWATAHDELARVRARLEATERELGRMRRRDRGGVCACRDDAAQAWADIDVLHERLRAAQAKAAQWQEAAGQAERQLVDALQEIADLRAELANRPIPQLTVHNPDPEPRPRNRWWGDPRWKDNR